MHEGVIVTGFEPFSNFNSNISQKIAELISKEDTFDFKISTSILTVDESGSREISDRIECGENIGAVIHLGFSEGASEILLERYAKNRFQMRISDNSGRTITSRPISSGNPTLETKVPTNFIDQYLKDVSAIRWSYDAGGFVCNETYFRSLLASSERQLPIVLFIHLPSEKIIPLEEQYRIILLICKSINRILSSY